MKTFSRNITAIMSRGPALRPILAAGFLSFLLGGCTVGPKYVRPSADVPADFKDTGDWKTAQPSDAIAKGKWWEIYQDAELNSLERTSRRFEPESESGAGAVRPSSCGSADYARRSVPNGDGKHVRGSFPSVEQSSGGKHHDDELFGLQFAGGCVVRARSLG